MIPAVIIPAISRFEILEANLARFDEPVSRLVIVDNSLTGYTYRPPADSPFARVDHIRPILGIGVTGGFNAGIMQTPDAAWWLLSSVDIAYGPGDLGEIAELMDADPAPAVVTGSRDDERLLRGAYMAVNRAAVELVGLYDEWAFWPLYFEDDDFVRRCELGGVEWIEYDGQIAHDRSLTIRSSVGMARDNERTYPECLRRYVEKWGGAPGRERFQTPYDLPVPLSFTRPDLAGRASRVWETTHAVLAEDELR
jgi:GT2 family glycosyltransferase